MAEIVAEQFATPEQQRETAFLGMEPPVMRPDPGALPLDRRPSIPTCL